ncbi:GntR family transcriptional regulator [Arenibacterium sp. CAU 1754]
MIAASLKKESARPVQGGPATGAPDRVYTALRERILSFDLPPGAVLSRNDIAREYGVSQTPVRDALQRLGQDGLVRIYPQSKTIVAPIDSRQLSETHFLRVAVETEVVRRLAADTDHTALKRSRGILKMQRALMEAGDQMDLFADLDRDFHRSLFEAVGMVSLHEMLTDRLGHLYRCQRLELPREGKARDIVEAHEAILNGIESGDPEKAASAVRAHLSGTISRVESIRAEYPDYFSDGALG